MSIQANDRTSTRGATRTARPVVLRREPGGALVLQPRRRRDTALAALLAPWLDARLARGVDPECGRLLAVRAARLTDPRTRRAVADGWESLLARASSPAPVLDARVPVARREVTAAALEIAGLVAALRGTSVVAAHDVARARALLVDGRGPVYRRGGGLRSAVAELTASLGGGHQADLT